MNLKGHFGTDMAASFERHRGAGHSRRPSLSELPQIKAGIHIVRRAKRPIRGAEHDHAYSRIPA